MKIIKKIISEPLFHFIFLGFILYFYYNITADTKVDEIKIVNISSYELQQIKQDYKKKWNQDINDEYLKALIAKKYYEKLLLNEAYSLGLEKQDKVISERLLKQMKHIMINSSKLIEPNEEELHRYYLEHIDDYSHVSSISFTHIFFANPTAKEVEETLKLLKIANIDVSKASYFGEKFILPNSVENHTYEKIKSIYGKYFTQRLFSFKQGMWHNAVLSKYGTHLIYVVHKSVGESYPFDEIEDRVYEDYLYQYRLEKENQSYKSISSQYKLEVE